MNTVEAKHSIVYGQALACQLGSGETWLNA
jgi:hypothetical protein